MIKRTPIKPALNQPIVMLLDRGPEGKEVSNLGKTEFQYTVNEDRGIIWLPPEGRAAILRSGARAGDQIQLMHTPKGWSAQLLGDSSEPPPPPEPPRMVAPRPAYSNGNGNGHQQAAPPPAPPPAPPVPITPVGAEPHPIEALMYRCFVAGGRTLWKAYQKLVDEGCGYDVPTIEDVRAAGITLYIERTKNGGVQ